MSMNIFKLLLSQRLNVFEIFNTYIMHFNTLLSITLLASLACAYLGSSDLEARNISGTSHVWLDKNTGSPQYMASGILLGIPIDPDQIPDHWLSDIKFWNCRSGGSQLGIGARGWTRGKEEFMVSLSRFDIS